MKLFIAAALAAACLHSSAPAFAGDGGDAFDQWLNPGARPVCTRLAFVYQEWNLF